MFYKNKVLKTLWLISQKCIILEKSSKHSGLLHKRVRFNKNKVSNAVAYPLPVEFQHSSLLLKKDKPYECTV
jgi:hypothetical protein